MAANGGGLTEIVTSGKADEDRCRRSQNGEPMTPRGSIFHHSYINGYILAIIGLTNPVDVPSMKAALQSTVINHSRFSSVVKKGRWGNCKWIRREVDIDKHIIVPDLSYSYTQRMDFVEDYTASLANTALDSSRPLWEIHVLNRKSRSAEAQSASVVFKIHHCIGDCVSLMSLFLECTRKASDPQSLPTIQHHPRPANPNKHPFCRNSRTSAFRAIWNAIFVVWLTLLDLLKLLATLLWMKDDIIPPRSGSRSQPKRLAHVAMDLEDVGIVRKAVNGTMNEVVTGILSAGFVRYFSRHSGSNNANKSINQLRAIVPVNMRSSPGLHKIKYMMENPKQARWGNELGMWILPIPLDKHEDPLEYCRVAIANSKKKKASLEALYTRFFIKLLSWLMGTNVAMYFLYRLCLNTTLIFSNTLGPIEEVQFISNPVTHIVTTLSWSPQPLVIHFQTYARKAKLAIIAAEDFIPNPEQLCMDYVDALKQMKQVALASLNCQSQEGKKSTLCKE